MVDMDVREQAQRDELDTVLSTNAVAGAATASINAAAMVASMFEAKDCVQQRLL
jgi:hypothetical protein